MLIKHASFSVRFPGCLVGMWLLLTSVGWAQNFAYTINSDPSGLVNQSGVVASGTLVTTPLAAETVSGNIFGYWRVNGVRQADSEGVAPRQVSFTVAGATTVTAVYFPATADTDEDGVADWYEWRQFGSLGQT
ncbi:MAG: hypothetical protein KA257_02060, partial [Opitutaceae bacterium]|nr:hypothetical protein [Opitutaceae bacterium]